MVRVMAYVDGFNLYFGLRSKGWRKYYWLDLQALSQALLKPGQQLQGVHYFTARICANGHNVADMQRQTTYLEALATLPGVYQHFGHFLSKQRQCRHCGSTWTDYEEKMTDVNLAAQLLTDAFDDKFDTALLFSGDSDLTTPVSIVRAKFPLKRIVVAFPPGRHSVELERAAQGNFTIGEAKLRQSQLPTQVVRSDGHQLQRPAHWE